MSAFHLAAAVARLVFIEGQCVGGYDDLLSLQKSGDLEKRLQGAGAI